MDNTVTAEFEANRPRLQSVAYRMLGSLTEAEDAAQETWMSLNRSDPESNDNLGGWLTTVLSRVCLGVLRARRTRPEEPMVDDEPTDPNPGGPEDEALLADTLGERAAHSARHARHRRTTGLRSPRPLRRTVRGHRTHP